MLLESLLAVGVIIALSSGIPFSDYIGIVFPAQGNSNPILAFSLAFSGLLYKSTRSDGLRNSVRHFNGRGFCGNNTGHGSENKPLSF